MKVRYKDGRIKQIIDSTYSVSKDIIEIIDFEDVDKVYFRFCLPDIILPKELGKNMINLSSMFECSEFNGDISGWDVSKVINMESMFEYSKFNGDISGWDVSKVTNMRDMFDHSRFNGDISGWDVSKVTDMRGMFEHSKFNGDISDWDVRNVKNAFYMFYISRFNGDITTWELNQKEHLPLGKLKFSMQAKKTNRHNGKFWETYKLNPLRKKNKYFNMIKSLYEFHLVHINLNEGALDKDIHLFFRRVLGKPYAKDLTKYEIEALTYYDVNFGEDIASIIELNKSKAMVEEELNIKILSMIYSSFRKTLDEVNKKFEVKPKEAKAKEEKENKLDYKYENELSKKIMSKLEGFQEKIDNPKYLKREE